MNVNEKLYLWKPLQEWGKGGIRENDGEGELNYDIFDMP
jgi:hypothetical protein